IVLGYWDLRGICESIRYLLHFAEVEFEDKRYTFGSAPDYGCPEWKNDKFNLGLDFPNLPYLFDGDVKLTQSLAILRYLARKYKLVGESEAETMRLDVLEQELLDLRLKLAKVVYSGPAYEKLREEYLKILPEKLQLLSNYLGDKKFVNGNKVTYVDFILYEVLDFNYIFESTSLDAFANLNSFRHRFENLPAIQKYMSSGKFSRLPIFGPFAAIGGKKE
ncbi:glutathione S-transferase Mu 1-like protein, partial [Leptotrombidium deliense]